MSVHAISAALRCATPSPTCKLVLIALANYADEENRCFPSVKKLVAETQLSDRAIRNAIRQLIEAGLVEKTERRRANGTQTSDEFRLCFQTARGAVSQPAPDAVCEPDRLHVVPVQTARRAGPTTFEPSLEPSSAPDGAEAVASLDLDAEAWTRAVRVLAKGRLAEAGARKFFGKLLKDHRLMARDLLSSLTSAEVAGTQDPQGYLVRAASAVAGRRSGGAPAAPRPEAWPDETWEIALEGYRDDGLWSPSMGPEPGQRGCRAPPHLIASVLGQTAA